MIKTLKSNLSKLSIKSEAKIIQSKVEELNFNNKEKYQIFFLDPPYKDASFLKNLNKIKDFKIFDKYHLVVIHEKDSNDLLQNLIHKKREDLWSFKNYIWGIQVRIFFVNFTCSTAGWSKDALDYFDENCF